MVLISFKYIHGDSFIHRLDVRNRIFIVIAYTIMALMFWDLRVLLVLFAFSASLWFLARIPMKELGKPLLSISTLIVFFTFATNVFFPRIAGEPKHIIWRLGAFQISLEAIFYCILVTLRYLIIFPAATTFILTTHPTLMTVALSKLKIPNKLAYVMNIALRYLPTLGLEYDTILNAQRARGFEVDTPKGGLVGKIKCTTPIMVPMMIHSINRAELIADAMDLRCFSAHKERTWYHDIKFTKKDSVVSIILLVAVIACITLRLWVFTGLWIPV